MQDLQSKELPSTRIQPDRRWFGNTRVIGQPQLERFREEMGTKVTLLTSMTLCLNEYKSETHCAGRCPAQCQQLSLAITPARLGVCDHRTRVQDAAVYRPIHRPGHVESRPDA